MTSAAGALALHSFAYGDELFCSKWSEAYGSAYGSGWLPVQGSLHTQLRCPLYGHDYGLGMYAGINSSEGRNNICRHGICNITSVADHVDYSLLLHTDKKTMDNSSLPHPIQRCTQKQKLDVFERQLHGPIGLHLHEHAIAGKGSLIALVQRCIQEGDVEAARQLRAVAMPDGLHLDEHVGSYLLHMFSSSDRHIFGSFSPSNDILGSAIISVQAKFGYLDEALALYHQIKDTIAHFDSHVFVALLEACSAAGAISKGRSIHSDVLGYGFAGHLHVCNVLIVMYGRCGSIEDACLVFDRLSEINVGTWNSLITIYTENGKNTHALHVYELMESSSTIPDGITYVSVLKACCGISQLEQGRMVYSKIMENGLELDSCIGQNVIEMFCRCDEFTDACCTFHRLRRQDVEVWQKPITTFVQNGKSQEVIQLLQVMQDHSIEPDWSMCLRALHGVVSVKEVELLHSYIVKSGMEAASLVVRMVLDMYFHCGSVDQANKVFIKLKAPDVTAWSALIRGYLESGHNQEAFDCFNEMQEDGILPDQFTAVCILKGCFSPAALSSGQKVHFLAVVAGFELNVVVCNSLVVMYSKCGSLEDARAVFDKMSARDVITWNSIIDGYSKHGFAETALNLFDQMCQEGIQPNLVTFVGTLKACSTLREIERGQKVHAQLVGRGIKLDPIISNTLLDLYSKCGSFEDAQYLFDCLPKQAVIPWNTLMAGYSLHRNGQATLDLFQRMQAEGPEPDSITFVCVLKACLSLFDIEQGKEIHSHIVKSGFEMDVYIGNILVSMYGHCGSMEDAHKVFDLMQKRDIVTWSALMTGYTHGGQGKEVLQICDDMWSKGMDLDEAAFVCILKACSETAALEQGRNFHGYAVEKACELNPPIASTLITMYGKCGDLDMACLVFNKMPRQCVVSCNAMLAILGEHGQSRSSVQLFESMIQAGMKPNNITFTCLLSACRSLELVDEGCFHFTSMQADHGIVPEAEHYGCIVDILAKGRLLGEAEDLLETIPMASNIVGWTSLLSSCNGKFDINIGKRCFNCAVNIDPTNTAVYVLMSGLYKCAGLHKYAEEVESLRKHGNKWKKPGRAYIEINRKVHEFVVGDKTHPQIEKIHLKVKMLRKNINDRISILHSKLPNLPKAMEDKEDNLCGHSEKLALAFGLLSTNAGTTIRVAKNIRMCNDCHTTTRLASLIENREIIITDSYRIHNFREGLCSCKE